MLKWIYNRACGSCTRTIHSPTLMGSWSLTCGQCTKFYQNPFLIKNLFFKRNVEGIGDRGGRAVSFYDYLDINSSEYICFYLRSKLPTNIRRNHHMSLQKIGKKYTRNTEQRGSALGHDNNECVEWNLALDLLLSKVWMIISFWMTGDSDTRKKFPLG